MSFLNVMVGAALKGGLGLLGRARQPVLEGSMTIPGLSGKVEIIRDRWGVPHIYASTNRDLFFAQGFVHAQDRLWQMETHRRLARGRLAELVGEVALETDRASRAFGFDRIGQADWATPGALWHEAMEAYAAGVNAYLSSPRRRLPVEFTLLGHRPEPWTPRDSNAFARLVSWELSHAWCSEITRAQLIEAVGPERAAELEISYPPENPVTLPLGVEFRRLEPTAGLPGAGGPHLARGQGSNSWVVSGAHTTTGRPFLCNDTHLNITTPSIWYEAHLEGGDFRVIGFSIPGVPGIMIGHNERIAWGITLAFTDCEDLFVEQFEDGAGERASGPKPPYRYAGQWLEAEVVAEPIRVKGRPEPVANEVVITRHGPLIGDVVGCPGKKLAISSMALRPGPVIDAWLGLDLAKGWDDFAAACRKLEAPQLNITYADVDGNIGYWVTGKVPVRAKGSGMVPAVGWTGEQEWVSEVPAAEMPHALNPAAGYLVTCNNRMVPDSYPHYLGSVWMNGFRARRLTSLIEEALAAGRRLGPKEFAAMQTDFMCLPGLEFVRRLEAFDGGGDPDLELALRLLRAWDGRLTADCLGGTVYEVARRTILADVLGRALGPELVARVLGLGSHPLLYPVNEYNGQDVVALLRMLDDPDSWWLGQAGGREAVVRRGLGETVRWLRAKLGPDERGWRWGRLHRIFFPHAMGAMPPLDRVFNLGPGAIGGDNDTPWMTGLVPGPSYDANGAAPAMRQIIDLADFDRSLFLVVPGQSGNQAGRHRDDLTRLWLQGEYQPMAWSRPEVEEVAETRLVLEPAPA